MRLDLWLWLVSGVLVLIAAVLRLSLRAGADAADSPAVGGNSGIGGEGSPRSGAASSPRPLAGWRLWAPLVLTCGGLAALVAGLSCRIPAGEFSPWPFGMWLGNTSADGVAVLAGGTLAILVWILITDARRVKATKSGVPGGSEGGLDRDRVTAETLALFATCLLILLALGVAWRSPWPDPHPQVRSWLFIARLIAGSLGLGAWLPAFLDAVWGLRHGWRRPEPEPLGATLGPEAMRIGYPWLTAAWLFGAAWGLAAATALWRGLSAEAWLMVAWLLGGIYLLSAGGSRPARLPQWALALLTACGATAGLLQAWQTPLLI